MERKRAQVISLPTDKFTGLFKTVDKDGDITLHYSLIEKVRENNEGFHLYIVTDDEIKEDDWCILIGDCGGVMSTPQQWLGKGVLNDGLRKIIATTDPELSEINQCDGCQKGLLIDDGIHRDEQMFGIACTKNRYKQLPQPSKAFIEEHCKVGGIDEVEVEYEPVGENDGVCNKNEHGCICGGNPCYAKTFVQPKVDSHNTITIHPIEDSWSREEVEQIARKAFDKGVDVDECEDVEAYWKAWIKENL